jgi:hypothetical protein
VTRAQSEAFRRVQRAAGLNRWVRHWVREVLLGSSGPQAWELDQQAAKTGVPVYMIDAAIRTRVNRIMRGHRRKRR